MEHDQRRKFQLPYSIITQTDLSAVIYELENVNNFFLQASVREPGTPVIAPRTTPTMEDLLRQNGLNLLKPDERANLKYILETIREKSPVIHMSFSVSPDRRFLEKVIAWLRVNINDLVILQVGLQPNMGAGFTIRTTNHFFDFSLRQYMSQQSDLLIKELKTGVEL